MLNQALLTIAGNKMITSRKVRKIVSATCITLMVPIAGHPAYGQAIELPAGKSEYRYNQSNGISNSVAVGITSSFGVNSAAQASSSYNASTSASLILNADGGTLASGSQLPNYNSSVQTIGSEAGNSPVNVKINSQTIQTKATDGSATQETVGSKQSSTAEGYTDNGETSSTAEFSAEGFGGVQDLRFKGGADSSGSQASRFTADVIPLLTTDENGNMKVGDSYSTGSANSNAETRTRFQADVTTSTFVNAFISSF